MIDHFALIKADVLTPEQQVYTILPQLYAKYLQLDEI